MNQNVKGILVVLLLAIFFGLGWYLKGDCDASIDVAVESVTD